MYMITHVYEYIHTYAYDYIHIHTYIHTYMHTYIYAYAAMLLQLPELLLGESGPSPPVYKRIV